MVAYEVEKIVLDYAGVEGLDDILKNLSGVATAGSFLWTASDEGRTVECLEPSGDGYRLLRSAVARCGFAARIATFAFKPRRIARRRWTDAPTP